MSDTTPTEAAYRCPTCRHGRFLTGCAESIVFGRVLEDGSVEESDSDQHTVFRDSIQCERHPEASVQWSRDGRWWKSVRCLHADERHHCELGRWMWLRSAHVDGNCPRCKGHGWLEVEVGRGRSTADAQPTMTNGA